MASAARDSQAQPAPAGSVVAHRVASGDNLTKILRQHGVRDLAVTVVELLRDKRSRSRLSTLRSGEELFIRQHEGALVELSMDSSAGEAMVMKRNSKGRFYPVFEAKETETVIRVVAGQVQRGVFFDSAVQAGLSASMVQGLVRHLEWRVDFGKDIRNGDRFRVLLKEVVAGGQAVSPAQAVAVQYQGARVSVTLYRHMDGQFYTEDGETGALAFLRKPVLEYRRISSGFSPNRKHPITGRTAPHNGVDFSGPVGTPVLAAADGEVVEARYKRLNGNFIRIKHGKYQTYYLHLSDMAVTKGQRVRRGQVIGSLGNTGRSTGPHLHFEIHENGVPKNPLTMPLPASKDLEQLMAEGFIERLARYQSHLG
ncbi:peptidoglycan DD-metalloendopeptidase family protein [Ferrimonas marina]|uniref:peptidoglycan DD-metalloendopeptidase family protein n=1 Tax=Ferrimonas marina TaxID=299255 RepID=UPI0013564D6A|nr:peptidoglycan DD-metalloendopeptidase family protein [Ferrimonas marina]